ERLQLQKRVGNGLLLQSLGDQVKPLFVVFHRHNRLGALRKEQCRAAGAVLENRHVRLNEILQEIDGCVREPWNLEIERGLALKQVVGHDSRDVLRVQQKIPKNSPNLLWYRAVHINASLSSLGGLCQSKVPCISIAGAL